MDFVEATDRLTNCTTLADVADEIGVSQGSVRQARLDASASSYRSPPDGWQAAIARLATERAAELVKLAEQLRKEAKE